MLEIPLDFSLNINYKQDRFCLILLKKNLEFVSSSGDDTVTFVFNFMLLLAKVDLILKKLDYKENVLMACGFGHIKIIFALLIKVITFHIQAFII